MSFTRDGAAPAPWAVSCFGNPIARELAFRIAKKQLPFAVPNSDRLDATHCYEIVAIAGLLLAVAGDRQLLNEVPFALNYVQAQDPASFIEDKTRSLLLNQLRRLNAQASDSSPWGEMGWGLDFRGLIDELISGLDCYPNTSKTRFERMTRKDFYAALSLIGDCSSNGEMLEIRQINNPLDLIPLGRYQKIKQLYFQPLTDSQDPHCFDEVIKLSLQNWAATCTSLDFMRCGIRGGTIGTFSFPKNITGELSATNLKTFDSSNFFLSQSVLELIAGASLQTLIIGPNDLSADVFAYLDRHCPQLTRVVVRRDIEVSPHFYDAAVGFRSCRPQAVVMLYGSKLL